eukprot:GDKI01049032.1.p1 GENE.GDKI01049032.1~~GDKI01049032.1.p1  ORF type:complete len:123 (+),score=7.83 GDKI01049032.1:248-616(+)
MLLCTHFEHALAWLHSISMVYKLHIDGLCLFLPPHLARTNDTVLHLEVYTFISARVLWLHLWINYYNIRIVGVALGAHGLANAEGLGVPRTDVLSSSDAKDKGEGEERQCELHGNNLVWSKW